MDGWILYRLMDSSPFMSCVCLAGGRAANLLGGLPDLGFGPGDRWVDFKHVGAEFL